MKLRLQEKNLKPQRDWDGTIASPESAPSAQSCPYHKCCSRISPLLRAQRDQPQGKHKLFPWAEAARSAREGDTELKLLIGIPGTKSGSNDMKYSSDTIETFTVLAWSCPCSEAPVYFTDFHFICNYVAA